MDSVAETTPPTTSTTTRTLGAKNRAMRRPDEPALVARAQDGDEDAFSTLYERYHLAVLNYLYRQTGDWSVAEDLTADAFLKAWLHLPRTKPGLKWGPWVYQIATNAFLDRYRHERLLKWQGWDAYLSVFQPSQVASDRPDRDALDAETRREVVEVLDAMAQLPRPRGATHPTGPRYRAALVLREYHGLSNGEVAERLGITPVSLKCLLFRARRTFKALWDARHPGTGVRW